jgi:hypothetical protein
MPSSTVLAHNAGKIHFRVEAMRQEARLTGATLSE